MGPRSEATRNMNGPIAKGQQLSLKLEAWPESEPVA